MRVRVTVRVSIRVSVRVRIILRARVSKVRVDVLSSRRIDI